MAKKQPINKKMTFMEVIEKNPDSAEILFKNGMHCIGCAFAMDETLEQGAIMHSIDPDKLVNEINSKLEKTKKKKKSTYKKIKTKSKNKKKR